MQSIYSTTTVVQIADTTMGTKITPVYDTLPGKDVKLAKWLSSQKIKPVTRFQIFVKVLFVSPFIKAPRKGMIPFLAPAAISR